MKKFSELIIIIVIVALSFSYPANAQVAINADGTAPNASAMLDIKSTDRGLLLPLVANVKDVSNPAAGLLVFDQSVNCMRYYSGIDWSECIGKPFICGDPFMDVRDGKVYNSVQIGTQCWMAENLNIGVRVDSNITQTNNDMIEKYCYDNFESNCDTLGGLYQWDEMMQFATTESKQGVCPNGWHLPSDIEWTALTNYVKGQSGNVCIGQIPYSNNISKSLADSAKWSTDLTDCAIGNDLLANNATGFTALPAGVRHENQDYTFSSKGTGTIFWSSSQTPTYAWYRGLDYNHAKVYRIEFSKLFGFSVRCVMD